MPVPASNICAATMGTDIYVPGGYDVGGIYLSTLQVYHTLTDTWETITTDPLPAPRLGPGCAALNGKLYVFGGSDGTYQSTAYVYDPMAAAGSRWTQINSMTYPRAYLAGVTVNGKVYAVGGLDAGLTNLPYVEAYNPSDGMWHTVARPTRGVQVHMVLARAWLCAVEAGQLITGLVSAITQIRVMLAHGRKWMKS
jgi:N-acetylneuraminic acid mutarotase